MVLHPGQSVISRQPLLKPALCKFDMSALDEVNNNNQELQASESKKRKWDTAVDKPDEVFAEDPEVVRNHEEEKQLELQAAVTAATKLAAERIKHAEQQQPLLAASSSNSSLATSSLIKTFGVDEKVHTKIHSYFCFFSFSISFFWLFFSKRARRTP